jgi:hypothetical protein
VFTSMVVQSGNSPESAGKIAGKSGSSVYDIVTERILAELEKGEVPWRKPWRSLPPANLVSKKTYRGINFFLLSLAGYGSQYWLTFRQAQALGGNVRKGERGTKIVFWKFDRYETEAPDGETEKRKSAFLRYYTVFNLEQTEGLKALLALPPARPIESAEAIVAGMPNPPAFAASGSFSASAQMRPPCFCTIRATAARPTPMPSLPLQAPKDAKQPVGILRYHG